MCVFGEETFKQEFYSSEHSGRSCRKKRLKLSGEILEKPQALNLEKIYQKKNFFKKGPARGDHSSSHRKGSLYSLLELERDTITETEASPHARQIKWKRNDGKSC